MSELLRATPRNRVSPSLAFLKFQKLPGRRAGYAIDLPADALPRPYATMLRPTVMLDRNQLVLSASTAAAEQALAGGPRWQPDGASFPLVKKLPPQMVYMTLSDPRASTSLFVRLIPVLVRQINAEIALAQSRVGPGPGDVYLRLEPDMIPAAAELDRWLFPSSTTVAVDRDGAILTHRGAIPTLASPAVAGVLAAMVAPTVRSARETAQRARCVNNLRQIALAVHNYHAANNTFPRPAIVGPSGKPLLSWRVAILPYLEQQELYDKFKQDEAWDSPHNKALLKEIPSVYRCPSRGRVESFTTNYRVFAGDGALFEKGREIGVADVTDGTAATIMAVESSESVPWTKPDDLPFDPAAAPTLRGAGSPHPGGFHAAMASSAVRFLKNTIDPGVFRALITRAAGEVVRAGSF